MKINAPHKISNENDEMTNSTSMDSKRLKRERSNSGWKKNKANKEANAPLLFVIVCMSAGANLEFYAFKIGTTRIV